MGGRADSRKTDSSVTWWTSTSLRRLRGRSRARCTRRSGAQRAAGGEGVLAVVARDVSRVIELEKDAWKMISACG